MMTYDAADGYVLLYGGANNSRSYLPADNDTWIFVAGRWTEVHPYPSPPANLGGMMAYDESDGYVLLFGGQDYNLFNAPLLNQTWEYRAGKWTNLTGSLSVAPGPRVDAMMTYDPADHAIVLFGGCCNGYNINWNDTWEFRNGSWHQLHTLVSPLGRAGGTMAYSTSLGKAVLFGGENWSTGVFYNDTWAFSNGSWQRITTTVAPPGRAAASMAPINSGGDPVLFSGGNRTVYGFNDTWLFSNGSWSELHPLLAPFRGYASCVAWDPRDGYVVRYGGVHFPMPRVTNETWTFGPALLATSIVAPNPTDAGQPARFVDPYQNRTSPYTYRWTLGDGTTSSAQNFTHAYASPGTYTVTLSVSDQAGAYNNSSVLVTANVAPSLAVTAAPPQTDVGFEVNLSAVVRNGSPPFLVNWTLGDGFGANGTNVSHVYTSFGRYFVTAVATDAAGTVRRASTNVTVVSGPAAVLEANATVLDLGQSVRWAVAGSGGTGAWTYSYAGLPRGCPSASSSSLTCTPSETGNFTVTATVHDSVGASVTTAAVPLQVFPALNVTISLSRPAIDVGETVTLSAIVTSPGSGGVTFRFMQLPSGCTLATAPTVVCRPLVAGSYSVVLLTYDRSPSPSRSPAVSLVVNPALEVLLGASSSNVTVDTPVVFHAAVAGGTTPLSYEYLGLPSACLSSNLSTLTCVPRAVGGYNVTVIVTDETGARAAATVAVSVTAPASSASGSGSLLIGVAVGFALLGAAAGGLAVGAAMRRSRRATGSRGTTGESAETLPEIEVEEDSRSGESG